MKRQRKLYIHTHKYNVTRLFVCVSNLEKMAAAQWLLLLPQQLVSPRGRDRQREIEREGAKARAKLANVILCKNFHE